MIIRYPCEVIALDLLERQHEPQKPRCISVFNALY